MACVRPFHIRYALRARQLLPQSIPREKRDTFLLSHHSSTEKEYVNDLNYGKSPLKSAREEEKFQTSIPIFASMICVLLLKAAAAVQEKP
eukprot:scaffold22575_cov141-Cylindrotheca_fusiformis.AAC.47